MLCILSRTEVLLTSGSANLSLTDKDGNTALHLACSNVRVYKGAPHASISVWPSFVGPLFTCFTERKAHR